MNEIGGGGGHPDPEKGEGGWLLARSQTKFFGPSGLSLV